MLVRGPEGERKALETYLWFNPGCSFDSILAIIGVKRRNTKATNNWRIHRGTSTGSFHG